MPANILCSTLLSVSPQPHPTTASAMTIAPGHTLLHHRATKTPSAGLEAANPSAHIFPPIQHCVRCHVGAIVQTRPNFPLFMGNTYCSLDDSQNPLIYETIK